MAGEDGACGEAGSEDRLAMRTVVDGGRGEFALADERAERHGDG